MLTPRQQHLAFQRGMTIYERKLLIEAGRARNAYILKAAKDYAKVGFVPNYLSQAHQERIYANLTKHYASVTEFFGKLARSSLKSGRKAALTPVQSLVAEWITREAARKAKMISDTDRDDIQGAVASGMEEGLGMAEIATRIRKATGLTAYRASVIARTETHAAATYGSISSVREAEETLDIRMLKAWLPTSDNRTRPEHLAMRSHPAIPLDQKFIVGGEEMDRPGDPSASASQLCNCRCSLVYSEAE